MTAKTIAVVAMGDMGHAVARVLKEHRFDIITCLTERSETSRQMAERAGAREGVCVRACVSKGKKKAGRVELTPEFSPTK